MLLCIRWKLILKTETLAMEYVSPTEHRNVLRRKTKRRTNERRNILNDRTSEPQNVKLLDVERLNVVYY